MTTQHTSDLKHTPLPWRAGDAGQTVFGPPNGNPSPQTIAPYLSRGNVAFIVRACNSHYELLETLSKAADTLRDASLAFNVFGKPMAGKAIMIAEQETRKAIKKATS